ncbi:MAG: DUF1080 domain-containing protein [Planctomycetota bacterium]|nr:DUF1080 domain-containing protein [Planctomycetota bacterium]MDA1105377.1 DUF1080 domain-containing protein [Planctomycetota bacterium]
MINIYTLLAPSVVLVLAGCQVCSTPSATRDEPRSPLAITTSLANDWKSVGGAANYSWAEVDGVVVLTAAGTASRNGFLVAPVEVSDFDLTIDVRIERGNSGLQFRSQIDTEKDRVIGYQMEVDPTNRRWSGGVYEEGIRGWVSPPPAETIANHPFRPGEWNTYRVRCVGDHIQTWINGVSIVDLRDGAAASGIIALQCHSGDSLVQWRNLSLHELPSGRD